MSAVVRRTGGSAAALLAVLALGAGVPQAGTRGAEVRPYGVWACTMYGASVEQRFYLRLAADGGVWMARVAEVEEGIWRQLEPSRRWRTRLEFEDRWNGRTFRARLDREELGGIWQGVRDRGGWWCAAMPWAAPTADDEPPPVRRLLEALVPAIMASPSYPLRAIREAREGRTVSCFIVTGTGDILRPAVVESTDEIFREPTLVAVAVSRYRSWGDEHAVLPACRSFTFELRADGSGDRDAG